MLYTRLEQVAKTLEEILSWMAGKTITLHPSEYVYVVRTSEVRTWAYRAVGLRQGP